MPYARMRSRTPVRSGRTTLLACSGLIALLGLFGPGGCQCEPTSPADEVDELEYELFDSTHLLDADTLATIQRVDSDTTLHFNGTPAALGNLQRFDVLLAGSSAATPRGLMRLVTSTETTAAGLIVHTLPAPLPMAFKRLHVKARRVTPAAGQPVAVGRHGQLQQSLSFTQDGWQTWNVDEPLYDADDDPSSTYDQVYGKGVMAGGISYTFSIDADWDDVLNSIEDVKDCLESVITLQFECSPEDLLPEVKTGMQIDAGASAELQMSGVAFLGYSEEYTLYQETLEPITVWPLVFIPHLEVIAKFEGGASSQFNLTWSAHALAQAGLNYSTKSGPSIPEPVFDGGFEPGPVEAVLQAHASLMVGPQVSILLYDVIGPTASLMIGGELRADQDLVPCWHLIGRVDGSVGIFVGLKELPGFTLIDEKKEFNIAEQEFATGNCAAPPALAPPQAGDPDPNALQNPQFAPWAFAYPGTVDGHPYEGPGAQIEWSALTPTIDGHFWLTGSDLKVLTSLAPDGSVTWARRYIADVDFWRDTLVPDLLITRAVPTGDAAVLLIAHPYTLLKVDPSGQLFWARHFAIDAYRETWLRFTDAVADGSGGFYVAGTRGDDANDALTHDAWVLRLDAAGEVVWSRRLGDGAWGENPRALVALDDGVLAAGAMWQSAGAKWRGLVFRLDGQGSVIWARQIVADDCGSYEQRIHLTTALSSRDGDINVGASIENSGYEAGVLKIKLDGSMPWFTSFRSASSAHLGPITTALVQLPDSGFLAAGIYSGAQVEDDIWLAGLDAAGGVQWARRYGGHQNPSDSLRIDDDYPTLRITQDGGALVAAHSVAFTGEDATWAFKVPARSGALTLSSALNASVDDLATAAGQTCLTSAAWNLPVVDTAAPALETLTVAVEPVAIPAVGLLP